MSEDIAYTFSPHDISIKADANNGHGRLEGYAATFNNFDLVGEAFVPGAFDEYLDEFKSNGFLANDHDWRQGKPPIGSIVDAYTDDTGLWIVADFHSTSRAQEMRVTSQERLERGKSVTLSLGSRIKQKDRTKEGLWLKKAAPFEASLTNVPINPKARVATVKSSLLAGLTRDEHHAEVLAALDLLPAYIERERDVMELRDKSGRKISQERRERLSALMERIREAHAELEEMLKETEHPAPEEEARKAFASFLLMEARHKGVITNA